MKTIDSKMVGYFLLVFLCIGSVLAGTIGLVYNLESKDYLARLELEERMNLRLQLKIIANNFESIITDLLFLSRQNELHDFLIHLDRTHIDHMEKEYLEFIRKKFTYDQVRFLDETGMEIVRVNNNNQHPFIVEKKDLQFKGERYYFTDTIELEKDEIFVSPLDLNVENGKIQQPLKPMIRFGTPVFDRQNRKRGVIIFNYLGQHLIASIKDAAKLFVGEIMLINSDGYWLSSPNTEDEWGFMIKERAHRKFSADFPDVWKKISSTENNQVYHGKGLFTAATLYPLQEGLKSATGSAQVYGQSDRSIDSGEYFWKIVSFIPADKLHSETRNLMKNMVMLGIALFILSSIPSWLIAQAIVRRKLHQIELYRSANYDKLTALPNRSLFLDRFNQTLQQSIRYKRRFALLFIDLDGFKDINDTLGHDAGDKVLIEIGIRLGRCVRTADTVARMGGDEFTVLLTTIISPDDAGLVAGKIITSVSKPLIIQGQERRLGASIGISVFPEDGKEADGLIKKADDAMYRVKKTGKNNYQFSTIP